MQETQEMQVQTLGQEYSLEEEMTTHSNILVWEIPWTEEPSGLQSRGHKESGKHTSPQESDSVFSFGISTFPSNPFDMWEYSCKYKLDPCLPNPACK